MKENETNFEVRIDETVFRTTHKVQNVSKQEYEAWLNSPITKSLFQILDYYCILCGVQYGDDAPDATLHIMGSFDIKQAIIDRQKAKQNNPDK